MAFTLRQLQFFIAAAEAGSVSGAARALSISQSSVTEAIRALEDDLGITLFDRLARGIEITHKGSAFLRHARQILADVATARMVFREDAAPFPASCHWASPAWLPAMCCPTSCNAIAAPIRRSS